MGSNLFKMCKSLTPNCLKKRVIQRMIKTIEKELTKAFLKIEKQYKKRDQTAITHKHKNERMPHNLAVLLDGNVWQRLMEAG